MSAVDVLALVLGVALLVGGALLTFDVRGARRVVARANARESRGRARTPGGVALRGAILAVAGVALVVRGIAGG